MGVFRRFGKSSIRSTAIPEGFGAALSGKSPDGIIMTDSSGKCLGANDSACRMLGYTAGELRTLSFADIFPAKPAKGQANGPVDVRLREGTVGGATALRKNGSILYVDVTVHVLSEGNFISVFRDAGLRKRSEDSPNRVVPIYETLSRVSRAILRPVDRESLFHDICEGLAGSSEFGLAAVELLDESRQFTKLVSWKGLPENMPLSDGLLTNRRLTDSLLPGRAAMTGNVEASVDMQADPWDDPWHEEALKRDLHSAAAVPFNLDGKTTGVLILMSHQTEALSGKGIEALTVIGESISFALELIRSEEEHRVTVSALRESEERYRSAFEDTTIGLYRTTPDGKILMANQALLQMLGYGSLEELQQRDLQKEGFEPDYPRGEFISKIEAEGRIIGLEAAWRRTDGTTMHVRESAHAVRDGQGKTLYYEGTVEDISERKAAEKMLLEKNLLLDEMSRMAKIGGWEFRTDNLKGSWTDETARIHGLDPSLETNAQFGISFYEGESKEKIENAVNEAIESGKPYDLELQLTAADGTRKWVRTIANPIFEGGRVVKVRGTFQDISESKRSRDKIESLTRLYATLSQVNQTIVRTKNRNELYRAICDVAVQFGEFPLVAVGLFDRENYAINLVEWKGNGISDRPYTHVDLQLPQYREGLLSTAISKNKVVTSSEVPSMLETKHWREVLMKHGLNVAVAVPFRLRGEVIGVLTFYAYETDLFTPEIVQLLEEMGLDISFALDSIELEEERRRDHAALEHEKDRIAKVAGTVPGLIHSYRQKPDGTACMPYASPAIVDMYGFSPEEVAEDLSAVFARFHPDDVGHIFDTIAESARTMTQWHDEFRYMHPWKGEIWIEGRSMPVAEPDGSITWHGFIQDVTERKRAEKALRESEEKFRSIMNQMTDLVYLSNSDGFVQFASPACDKMFGFTADEMLGKHFSEFLFEPDIELAVNVSRKLQQTGEGVKNLVLRMKRKDGSIFYSELDSSPYRSDDMTGSMGVIRDITARKKTEEGLREAEARQSELERQLIQAQKLESLGTLAGGIAHDFNNLLGVIMGYSALIKEGNLDAGRMSKSVEAIEKASERGAALVKQLLTFARKTETVFNPISVNEIVLDTVRFLDETFPKTIAISTDLKQNLPKIIGDSTQLHQVMMNLCINARDAMPQGGSVLISTSTAGQDDVVARFPGVAYRDYAIVRVSDTGIGMDDETKRKVFDPFFTTKGPGKGTGLGLALVYSIVQNHGGFIWLESEPGGGTTFEIYFPAISAEPESVSVAIAGQEKYPGGSETILVIEDEELLLEMLMSVLGTNGYSIMSAKDGEEGLRLFSLHQNEIDAVITDLGLPKLGGDQVLRQIKALSHEAKIIVASGFIDPELRADLFRAGATFFVQKPYVPAEILKTLRAALDS